MSLPIIDFNKEDYSYSVEMLEEAKEIDRESKVTGGLIEGEEEVPYAKEKPEERINPFTGEPYTALYNGESVRQQYAEGGSDDKKKVAEGLEEAIEEVVGGKVLSAYKFNIEIKPAEYFADSWENNDPSTGILKPDAKDRTVNTEKERFGKLSFDTSKDINFPDPIFQTAMGVIESGWGASKGAQEKGIIFGRKARAGEKGTIQPTKESRKALGLEGDPDELVTVDERFADLSGLTVRENFEDNFDNIKRAFPEALEQLEQGNWKEAAKWLKHKEEGGYITKYWDEEKKKPKQYATDPAYIKKLIDTYKTIQKMNLTNPPPPLE